MSTQEKLDAYSEAEDKLAADNLWTHYKHSVLHLMYKKRCNPKNLQSKRCLPKYHPQTDLGSYLRAISPTEDP